MKVSGIRIAVIGTAVAMLAFAGVAYAGNGTHDRIQQKLHDGSCLTVAAAGDGAAAEALGALTTAGVLPAG